MFLVPILWDLVLTTLFVQLISRFIKQYLNRERFICVLKLFKRDQISCIVVFYQVFEAPIFCKKFDHIVI